MDRILNARSSVAAPAGDPRGRRWRLALWIGLAALAAGGVACMTGQRVLLAPPHIPNAEFIGSESCVGCHEPQSRDFHTATHSQVKMEWNKSGSLACESCHGPASAHVESGGALGTIVNPKRSSKVCFECHLDMRGKFSLPHHHPVAEGDVSCSDCHDSHRGSAIRSGPQALAGANQGCVQCHPQQWGPFAFHHEAMREGCVSCHDPHGSINSQLLTARGGNLCLKCHVDVRTADITIGGLPHSFLMKRGTCWTAGCHEAVHGSQVSSSLRF